MPTYDYVCNGCGHEFELFQSINDPVRRKCPQCSKLKLRRLFGTGAAVVFKGSGFYQTDYRSEAYKKAASAESGKSDGKQTKSSDPKTSGAKSETSSAKKEGSSSEKSSGKSKSSDT